MHGPVLEHHMVRAIELDPNYSPARIWYALQLAMEGRFSEALREAHTGRDLDPLAVISRFTVVWCSYHARRYDEAYRFASATLENEPRNTMMHYASSRSQSSWLSSGSDRRGGEVR